MKYKLVILDYSDNIVDYVKSPYITKKDSLDYFRNVIHDNPILLNNKIYKFEFVEVIDTC